MNDMRRISLLDLFVMDILVIFGLGRFEADFDDEEGPEEVHGVENERHGKQVVVLEGNNIPDVFGGGSVHVDVGQQAEGKNYDSHPDPDEGHHAVDEIVYVFARVDSLDEKPSKGYHDIAGVVHNQYHGPSYDLVAHCRKQD